ncbi:MAG TPA: GerMN domain-containing protein [Vicinamibacterales bacterium]|jgi:spore germination protein GerM|nr:GerMN domain-containing protein [Vicinamibacterales bacterium]
MTVRRNMVLYASLATVLLAGLVAMFIVGPRWLSNAPETAPTGTAQPAEARKIHARLFYVDPDGEHLVAVEQEVLYGEGTTEQAKRIIEAALVVPPAPNLSAIPAGTKLKALYLTSKGEAYVDLSPEVQKNHPGGTTSEMLTVYALVNTLTSNLPAITGVQLLIDGKEIDTLAGHLDLRRPLAQNLTYANRQSNP